MIPAYPANTPVTCTVDVLVFAGTVATELFSELQSASHGVVLL
jgi:hypothetical protein